MKTNMNQWFEKVRNVFFGVAVSVFVLSLMVTSCKSTEVDLPEDEPTEAPTVQRKLRNEHLVALAVCRVYDGKGVSLKGFSSNKEKESCFSITKLNTDDNPIRVKYPFDFVEINDAVYFIAQSVDFPFLNEICGNGEIEVFQTSFNTYIYADETKDESNLQPHISDDLIVFRGEWGMYSCMSNSGSYNIIEYSSHKFFGENAIEKDFTPPLYQFFVKNENGLTWLTCTSNEIGSRPDQSAQWTILEGGDIISSEHLFSTEELLDMPEMTQQCTITDIGEDYFMVSGEYNLEKIFFDEYTLFFADDQPAKATEFAKGDVVTVTFNKPYERYNPRVAVANQIIK